MKVTSEDEDARLMEQVAAGDKAAFARLFDRYQSAVVRFSWRFVGSQARAEELGALAFRLSRASSPIAAARIKQRLMRGFYGT